MANEKTIKLNLAQMILFRKLAEIYYDPKILEKEKPNHDNQNNHHTPQRAR